MFQRLNVLIHETAVIVLDENTDTFEKVSVRFKHLKS